MKEVYDYKILIVDDEPDLRRMVSDILSGAGFRQVHAAAGCGEARREAAQWGPEAVLLDVMLPDGDGFSLYGELWSDGEVPVLFLSAMDEDESRLTGLVLGADDYITKPFLPRELVLRLSAVLRRAYGGRPATEPTTTRLGSTVVDWGSGEVARPDGRHTLTAKEYAILRKLCDNRGNIVTIDALCLAAWGQDEGPGYENSLMVHIRRLREKIEDNPSRPRWLLTARGLGYKLERGGAHE